MKRYTKALSWILTTFFIAASNPLAALAGTANPATAPVHWTPVIMLTTTPPRLFRGSDSKYNLVYDIVLVNYNLHPAKLTQFEVLDDRGTAIKVLSGKELSEMLTAFGNPSEASLAAGSCGVISVNLNFDKPEQAPKQLNHRLSVASSNPLGKEQTYQYDGAALTVDSSKPLVIGPPLKSGRWFVGGGYNGKLGHRRALFAIDNSWKAAQRYAIDWVMLNDKNYSSEGDRTSNASSPGYGKPVIAVADATVYGVVESFLDQPPGKPVGEDRMAFPAGNSVTLDLGKGNYALYAHLRPGSIKVKEGEKVKRGQQIAELGNSGNTTGPHLHFHLQDGPNNLGANCIPYVFDSFLVTGQSNDIEQFEKNEEAGKPQTIDRSPDEGNHKDELPKEGTVLSFPD